MTTHRRRRTSLAVVLGGIAVLAACASTDPRTGTTTTTGASLTSSSSVLEIAVSRCRRAAECNRIGFGQMYETKGQCMQDESEVAIQASRQCSHGVDPPRLDDCINSLENQNCDADLGPVTAMPGCDAYCARIEPP